MTALKTMILKCNICGKEEVIRYEENDPIFWEDYGYICFVVIPLHCQKEKGIKLNEILALHVCDGVQCRRKVEGFIEKKEEEEGEGEA